MTQNLDDDDFELDRQWRARFGEPLPILGAAALARRLLTEFPSQAADEERSWVPD